MGFGDTAKRLQRMSDLAESLYERVNQMAEQLKKTRETVADSNERIERLEGELAEQRALVEELARQQGIDAEAVTEDVAVGTGDEETASATQGADGASEATN